MNGQSSWPLGEEPKCKPRHGSHNWCPWPPTCTHPSATGSLAKQQESPSLRVHAQKASVYWVPKHCQSWEVSSGSHSPGHLQLHLTAEFAIVVGVKGTRRIHLRLTSWILRGVASPCWIMWIHICHSWVHSSASVPKELRNRETKSQPALQMLKPCKHRPMGQWPIRTQRKTGGEPGAHHPCSKSPVQLP